jgi:hypothetical protein
MMGMISDLLAAIWKALRTLGEFLVVILLGMIAALLFIMPWLLRALALIGWLAGTFMIWLSINNLYSASTPALPLMALTAVPAILSAALVVWLFYREQQERLWGAMTLWGVMGWLIWKGSLLLPKWQYGSLAVQVLPAALSAVLLIYINIRWGVVIRARRFRQVAQSTIPPEALTQASELTTKGKV